MKILDEKTIEEKACTEAGFKLGFDMDEEKYYQSNKVNVYESFKAGCETAESLLLPKMILFAEWISKNNYNSDFSDEHGSGFSKYNSENELIFKTTSELLDIWIEQNKHN